MNRRRHPTATSRPMDIFSPEKRSRIMRRVRSENTKPEMVVRRLAHGLGYRFRLHRKDLPGRPDLVFAGRRKIIFVHGCFWHQHSCRRGSRTPSTRREYWLAKLQGNVARDKTVVRRLRTLGWGVMVVWECQTTPGKLDRLAGRIARFLEKS
ncbi:MAG: DNA mismatch endonuclease Vsr [Phycisphaerae bacterium]|nr:DNA mismatch endonuclease Vsr [Phycisphaerae bacterium]